MNAVFVVGLLLVYSVSCGQPLLYRSGVFDVFSSKVVQGNFEATAVSSTKIISNYYSPFRQSADNETINAEWNLEKDVSVYPQYHSDQVLVDALYTKAMEEMLLNVRPDGTFMAGAKWDGVWTRDISYSILLSLAIINPDAAKVSLKAKVKNGRIIQDTGTGGSWPISTDRMTWALAAWEVYLVTGDEEWLHYAYSIIKNSVEDDQKNAVNSETGLMFGESSFLDWREQTYPRWMDPKDIYESQALGTNAVHCHTYQILAEMANLCGENPERYLKLAERTKSGINTNLWLDDKGYYGQYLYGRTYQTVSPKSEALGEALTILFNIADGDRASKIVSCTPILKFGTPCIYPQIPNIPSYHNDAIWPFVEAFWTWASVKVGNAKAVEHGLASIYRAAALFNTNKENMVATTGDYLGTQINSDRQLWSVAGNLATIYRILYGMEFTKDGLSFAPFVPPAYTGDKSINNFKYRNTVLTINLKGTGNIIQSVMLDSVIQEKAFIPSSLKGDHTLTIVLRGNHSEGNAINFVRNEAAPECPVVKVDGKKLVWNEIADRKTYVIYKNGREITRSMETSFKLPPDDRFAEYQVMAVNAKGFESFLSEPISVVSNKDILLLDASATKSPLQTDYTGFTKKGYIRLEKSENQKVDFTAHVAQTGLYRIDVRYSNGNGPINTDNKCAIRTLSINGKQVGTIVFPQRGAGNWSNWGYSSPLFREIEKGINEFEISFKAFNNNMNYIENVALLDHLRLTLITK
jgi:glycogen debranching enzyme